MKFTQSNTFVSLLLLLSAYALTACSIFGSDNDYTKSASLPPLEVPPDLTEPDWSGRMSIPGQETARASAVESQKDKDEGDSQTPARSEASNTSVLPEYIGLKVRREGNVRWLEVTADTQALWPKLKSFWAQSGYALEKEEPAVGIMETEWYEHRDALPKGKFASMLGRAYRAISDTGVRDKYRLRFERVAPDLTNIYLTQQRAETVGDPIEYEAFVRWKLLPPSPEQEAEMLNRIMVFLGSSEEDAHRQIVATQKPPLQTILELRKIDGVPVLFVADKFSQVWRHTGVALDRAGLFVEQQDRSKGVYYVIYTVPEGGKREGFFSRLFSGGEDLEVNELYQVHVQSKSDQTVITAHNNGEDDTPAELDPDAAEKLLIRLREAYQVGGNSV